MNRPWSAEVSAKSNFTLPRPFVTLRRNMTKSIFAAVAALFLVTGCTTTTITNLTPSQLKKAANNYYLFEVEFTSNQRSIIRDTIKPQLILGTESFPMQRGPVLNDRWETLVPITNSLPMVYYQFKVDFDYQGIPVPRQNSRLSPMYKLEILQP